MGILDEILATMATQGPSALDGQMLAQAQPETAEIGGHIYQTIPPEQFNHDLYDRMELYTGNGARPNPPPYLLGHPTSKDEIKYWKRLQPFAGS
jgi:hypothetical protein